ncbi:MAG: PepSY domain-containing protein [Gammaproteobacteria bacterium]|nr:PepSY domain-containing protein [Gammaproteobacteria bacterium]
MTRLRLITAAVPLLALVLLGTASGDDYIEARRLMQRGDIKPLETIIEQLGRSHPGRILEVELEAEHGGYRYEIELLDASGRVWELEVDAVTGEILEQERED